MSVEAMKQALEALEYHTEQTRPITQTQEAITALRAALEDSPEEHWLTKQRMADYLDMIAEAIEDNRSETLRHKAHWLRKGEV